MVDPFQSGLAGDAINLMPFTGSSGRTDNTLLYTSPSIAGVTGEPAYSFG